MYRNSGVDQWKWEIGGREGGGGGGGGTGLLQLLHLPSCWNLLHVTSHAIYISRVTSHALHLTRYISRDSYRTFHVNVMKDEHINKTNNIT